MLLIYLQSYEGWTISKKHNSKTQIYVPLQELHRAAASLRPLAEIPSPSLPPVWNASQISTSYQAQMEHM